MRLKNVVGLLAALLFAFAVVACNDSSNATTAPVVTPAPAASEPAA